MKRIGSGVVIAALIAISTVPIVAGAAPSGVVAHSSGAVGSITCSALNGKVSFSPALRAASATVTVTMQLSSPQCSASDPTSTTSSMTVTSSQTLAGLTCSSLSSTTKPFSLAAHWSPSPSSVSTVGLVGMSMVTSANGTAAFAFPYSSSPSSTGTSSVVGAYSGANGGALSKVYLLSGLRGAALIQACLGTGLKTIPVVGGLLSLGGSAPSFTSSTTGAFTEGSSGTFGVTASTSVRAKMSWSGSLPAGLAFDSAPNGASATISGTPLVGTAGNYLITVTVRDENGLSSSIGLSISVAAIASNVPVVTSVTNNDGASGSSGVPGDSVTISGLNMGGVTSVMFGDTVLSASSATPSGLVILMPDISQGAYDVTVGSPNGTSPVSPSSRFVVHNVPRQPPTVAAFAEGLGVHVSWSANPPGDHVSTDTVTLQPPSGYVGTSLTCTNPIVVANVPVATSSLDISTSAACAGVPYVASVVAVNASGASVSSSPSDTVTASPATVPGGAVITHVSAANKSLTVFWVAPPWPGGVVLSSYDLAVTTGHVTRHQSVSASQLSATVSGLTNSVSYSVVLTARNAIGSANPSSSTGTPSASAVPEAPNSLLVRPSVPGPGLAISWSAPQYHSTAVTGYVVTVQPVDPPGVTCRSSVTQKLASGWKDGALLHVTIPTCAAGFSSISIAGHSYNAALSATKGAVSINGTSSGTPSPAVAQGTVVVWDTMVPTGLPTVVNVGASTTTYTVKSLSATFCYRVSVAAKNAVGVGVPIVSSAPVSPTVSLTSGTVALSDLTMSALLYTSAERDTQLVTYVWPSMPTQLATVHSGDTVITPASSAAGQAGLLLVQSFTTDAAGQYVLRVTSSDMTNAYNTFGFSFTGSPPSNGAHVAHGRSAHVTVNINYSSGGNSAHGTISVTPWVNVSASHWCTASVWGICYHWGISATASAGINASENLVLALSGSTSVEIFSCTVQNGCMPNIVFWIGPIPVQISPSVAMTLELSGNVNISSNASASWSGWITYNSTNNSFTSGSARNFTAAPGQNFANGTAHASLDLTFQLCAYGNVLCGHVTGSASVDLVFNTAVVAPANYLTVTCGLSVTAGFDVHIFGWNPSGSATLVSYSAQCYHIVAAAGTKVLTIAPVGLGGYPANTVPLGGNIATLSASRNDLVTPTLTWTLLNAVTGNACGDSITSLGHLSTACVGGNRTLIVRAVDSSTNPPLVTTRAIVVQSGYVFNAPPAPGISQYQTGFSQIHHVTLFMTPPANSGGYPMAYYYVHFSCPVLSWQGYGVQGVWAGYSPTTILQVQTFGLFYCTVVEWPINSNGAWGPSVTTSLFM